MIENPHPPETRLVMILSLTRDSIKLETDGVNGTPILATVAKKFNPQ